MNKRTFNRFYNISLLAVLALLSTMSKAQVETQNQSTPQSEYSKHYVFLKDKAGSSFNPYSYFDKKAIDRRKKLGINLYDSSDFPVSAQYLNTIAQLAPVKQQSRWFNMITVIATPQQLDTIQNLPFVVRTESAAAQVTLAGVSPQQSTADFELSESEVRRVKAQLDRMKGQEFRDHGYTGKGIRIAVFDAGFRSYKSNPAFNHLRKNERIIQTWDFVKNRRNVDGYNNHGTNVLSCIAGMHEDLPIGLATDAEFLLARTETWTEFYAEEENWLAAAEWADKNGADIINSSLGYTYHRYFRYNMDGKTAMVTRAANMAAKKGILVVNSAGNEGSDAWKNVGAPADADSVLSIGGIHHNSGLHTSFSSFGPTWDKRLKPNLCAYGHVIASGPKGYHSTQGTSFSSPLVAGFAACAWQSDTSLTNMQLFKELEYCGDLYPYFDYAHGYGVPNAAFFLHPQVETEPGIAIEENEKNNLITIQITDSISPDIWAGAPRTSMPKHVFYHIENNQGYLDKYFVVDVSNEDSEEQLRNPLVIDKKEYNLPFTVRVYYLGWVVEYKVEK